METDSENQLDEHQSNREVLATVDENRSMINTVRGKQKNWLVTFLKESL